MSAPMSRKIASDAEHANPPVVRTLKPPPEIWELVHPVEAKQFNPRQTFLRRLRSSATGLSLVTIVVGLVLGVCFVVLRYRGVQKLTAGETIQPVQVGSTSSGNDTANPPNSSAAAIDRSVTQPTDGSVSDNSRRATLPSSKRKVSIAVEAQQPNIGSETTTEVGTNPAPPPPARSQTLTTDEQSTGATDSNKKNSSASASADPKSKTSLSPQVIAPLKSDSTRKAKVIQWP